MRLWRDGERVAEHRRARVRRRAQPDGLRPQQDRVVVTVGGAVRQRGMDGHRVFCVRFLTGMRLGGDGAASLWHSKNPASVHGPACSTRRVFAGAAGAGKGSQRGRLAGNRSVVRFLSRHIGSASAPATIN
jgi:hypothetical protein